MSHAKTAPKRPPGRPASAPGARRVHVPLRLPEWLVAWIDAQGSTRAEVIEAAILKAHKLRAPHPHVPSK